MSEIDASSKVLDSTKMKDYQRCPRFFFYRHVLGLLREGASRDLAFGSAWHEAMAYLLNRRKHNGNRYIVDDVAEAMNQFNKVYRQQFEQETDADSNKNPYRAELALLKYIETYDDTDHFDVVNTETYGRIDMNDVYLAFRIDAILEDSLGVYIQEHKTTSSTNLAVWEASFPNDLQPKIYSLAGSIFFKDFYKVEINGVAFWQANTTFKRVPIYYRNLDAVLEEIVSWIHMIQQDLDNYQSGRSFFPMNGRSCVSYGKLCPYYNFCSAGIDPKMFCEATPAGFVKDLWDPLKGHEVVETTIEEIKR